MEHFALTQPAPMVPIAAGMRLILVRAEPSGGAWSASHEVHEVVGIQPMTVSHFCRQEPAPVHHSPDLMEAHGWQFRHAETRYAPVFLTAEGRLSTIDPADPRWCLVPPGTPDERLGTVAETLKAGELRRCALEARVENADELEREVEED